MKLRSLLVLSLICVGSSMIVSADTVSDLDTAKQYEGNFYSYHKYGDWDIFSDNGVSLGEPESIADPSIKLSYYVNEDDGYIIQYYKDETVMSYAVWKDGTVEALDCSR